MVDDRRDCGVVDPSGNTDNLPLRENLEGFVAQVRGSSLGHCPCRLARVSYKKVGVDGVGGNPTPTFNPRFADGHWHEFEVKERLLGQGVGFYSGLGLVREVEIDLGENLVVAGHVDGEVWVEGKVLKGVKEGAYVLEVKSMAPGSFWKFVKSGYREGFPEYFDQLQGYLNGTPTGYGSTMMDPGNPVAALYQRLASKECYDATWAYPQVGLVVAKNKETGSLWYEVIPKDEGYFQGLQRRWLEAKGVVAAGGLPPCIHEDNEKHWEVERCGCRVEQEQRVIVAAPTLAPVDTNLLEAARIYAAGRRLKDLSEAMMEYAEPVLSLKTDGKTQVGPVVISQTTQHRSTWDHKALERMLTSEVLKKVRTEKEVVVTRRTVGGFTGAEVRQVVEELRSREGFEKNPLLIEGGIDG